MLMSKIYVGTSNEHHTIQKQMTQTVSLTKTAIFIDESVRHLIVGKMKINKVSHFEKKNCTNCAQWCHCSRGAR